MLKQVKVLSVMAALFFGVMSVSGCFAILVGAAAGASGYAWAQGALVKEFNAPATDIYEASMKGLESLKVEIDSADHDRLTARIRSEFSDGKKIAINVDAITELTSKINIRVGVFGDKVRSELIYDAIKKYL